MKKPAHQRDPWVPIRVSSPLLIATLLDIYAPNNWWGITLKIIFTLLGIGFINSAFQIAEDTLYINLGQFTLWSAVLFVVAFWPNTPVWLDFVACGFLVINYGTIYSKFTLPDYMKGDSPNEKT
jgi:hypothetical protein